MYVYMEMYEYRYICVMCLCININTHIHIYIHIHINIHQVFLHQQRFACKAHGQQSVGRQAGEACVMRQHGKTSRNAPSH